jgi:hypothetical protein
VTPQSRRRTADNPVLWFRRAAVRYAGLVDQLRTYPGASDPAAKDLGFRVVG